MIGVVERPAGLGVSSADWEKALSQDFVRLTPDQLIAPYLDELSRSHRPVVVVREDDTLVGMVTGASVLKVLARNSGDKSASGETEPPVAVGAERAG
jgi:glycine betaine/proline transport system ATP-binding protein